MFIYKKLDVWKLSKELVLKVYEVGKGFPSEEKFSLTNQLNRASVSVASNIAEGSSRRSLKDQAHFSEIAYGSLMEVACQLDLAYELGFINNEKYKELEEKMENLAVKLSNYRQSQINRMRKS